MQHYPSTLPQETHWVGVDVAKATFDAALACRGQKFPATSLASVPVRTFPRTPAGVGEFLQWLDSMNARSTESVGIRVVMEATGGYSIHLAAWMSEQRPSLAPAIAPPRQTSAFIKSMGLRNKTDKLEARALAFYGMERQPPAYEALSPEEASLRELSRYRDFLIRQRVAEGNRAHEMSQCPLAVRTLLRRLAQMDRDIKKIETEIRKRIDQLPSLKQDIETLCTIYGVGFVTAVTIRTELGDLRRFDKARQLTAYAGLNPSLHTSGATINGKPHMNKNGNPRVRQALYLAAMVVIRGSSDLKQDYLRLCENGKSAMSAIGAIMRKLLVLMRAILISGKAYDPMWKTHRGSGKVA